MAVPSRRPRRRRPAAARTSASYSPSRSLRSRVSTFPRMGVAATSGRRARSWTLRRRLDVPTRAPRGQGRDPRRGGRHQHVPRILPRRERRQDEPPGRSAGRSFRLCTARSTCPSRRASSISFTKRPFPPTSARWAVARWYHHVRMDTSSTRKARRCVPETRRDLLGLPERQLAASRPDADTVSHRLSSASRIQAPRRAPRLPRPELGSRSPTRAPFRRAGIGSDPRSTRPSAPKRLRLSPG